MGDVFETASEAPGQRPGFCSPAQVRGVAVTPGSLTRHTDLAVLRDWVAAVRGCMTT
ncbi:MAG: hypothetical protein ACLP5E_07105 [Streptosporangiaceae bacterium]